MDLAADLDRVAAPERLRGLERAVVDRDVVAQLRKRPDIVRAHRAALVDGPVLDGGERVPPRAVGRQIDVQRAGLIGRLSCLARRPAEPVRPRP